MKEGQSVRQVELLAPVGKFENALAAIENGANAIFVGGKVFNARQFADNFEEDELEKIVDYCKLRGVKTHITVNTLIKDQEIEELMAYLQKLARLKVDAIIVQDLGVAYLIKTYFPEIELHASTQMSAHSIEDVMFLKSCGFKRVVLAREMQLEEIRAIKEAVDIEIETFIHGALCYSYSGQCLFSSQIGGRSGNRGRCAQPCRMGYALLRGEEEIVKSAYLLSPKDLCTLSFLPELIKCGIDSFKMEGRMKSPEYVASVTKVYRKYIDLALKDPKNYKVEQEDMEML
ncbi:MAG: peptidase U32 family protein, partial [Zhenhengia sp.]